MPLHRLTHLGKKRPALWLLAWTIWFITLWLLSSGNPSAKVSPPFPHFDKFAHFAFFFAGAAVLCAWLNHAFKLTKTRCVLFTSIIGSLIGILDEYHQSFTPGRSGNDLGDIVADTFGSLAGAITMILILKQTAAWKARQSQTPTHPNSAE